ncbi:MAG: GNAT family N-acetyltransferase [Oscillospiraceae bacterium]|nr:GNAT family N-acetyltransferase [Oscillospiraceae bacterium]
MDQKVWLQPMTAEMYHAYFKEYQNDPDLYLDPRAYTAYTYDVQTVERYIKRQIDLKRKTFAIMHGQEMVGELVIKNIEPGKCATMGLAMRSAQYKDRGYGTRAEQLAIQYVFHVLDIPILYADALITNTRSQHVLEKVGFRLIRKEGDFKYYSIERTTEME